jgi:hypothetical protein
MEIGYINSTSGVRIFTTKKTPGVRNKPKIQYYNLRAIGKGMENQQQINTMKRISHHVKSPRLSINFDISVASTHP